MVSDSTAFYISLALMALLFFGIRIWERGNQKWGVRIVAPILFLMAFCVAGGIITFFGLIIYILFIK